VVGADHRGVAGDVAAGEPALLDDADVGDVVVAREVVGRREAVPAAADDHDVVGVLGLGALPIALRFLGHPACPWPVPSAFPRGAVCPTAWVPATRGCGWRNMRFDLAT